jgi:hypothetical protein
MHPDNERALTKRLNYIGAGLIALAFIGPSIAALAGFGREFSVGEDIGRTLGSLVVLALLGWLVVGKKGDLAKAKATLVVGIVLCVVVGNNIARMSKEEDVAKAFVRDALALQAQQQEKFEHLGKRFEEVTFAQYMTADALVSQSSVAAGKAAVERFRSLLQERQFLLQTNLAESAALVAQLPEGEVRAGAESTLGPARAATEKLYKTLARTQSEQATAIGAIFDWAATNDGKLAVSNGELIFSSVEQRQELQALITRLQAAESQVAAASEEAQKMEAAELEKRARFNEEAAGFIAK